MRERPDVPYRLVALDADGTVLDSDQRVRPELKSVLEQLTQMGVHTVLCTGRRWRSALPVLRELEHAHPVAVCAGGALVKRADDGRTLHIAPLALESARLACELFRDGGLAPLLLYDRPLEECDLKVSRLDRELVEQLPYSAEERSAQMEWYHGRFPGDEEPPLAVYALADKESILRAEAGVARGIGEQGIVAALHRLRYGALSALEVHDPAATKWHALEWLLDWWDMQAGEVVAIGDDVNDIPMLAAAGLSFAMGDAPERVKGVARRVTATSDAHGVALALKEAFDL